MSDDFTPLMEGDIQTEESDQKEPKPDSVKPAVDQKKT